MMKRLWIIGVLMMMLCGCAPVEDFETMKDVYASQELSEPAQIALTLPGDAASPVMESENGKLYFCDGYGAVDLPDVMKPYIERMDFILGVQATAPHNCGALSFGETLYINMIRNIREPELENHFYRVLRELDLTVQAESNGPREH